MCFDDHVIPQRHLYTAGFAVYITLANTGTSVPTPPPFYLDWTFWAAAMAFVAITLSQIPPIHLLLRPKRLDVEVNSRIRVSHMVGNPNAGVIVSI